VEALDPRRVQRLLADLDSDEFAVREAVVIGAQNGPTCKHKIGE
jgi:hypothetical protein